jgi:stage II sporulation SpoAA-like protein
MITIEREDGVIVVGVFGELTLADVQRLEREVPGEIKQAERVALLIDLRDMLGATIDALLEDIKFSRHHSRDIRRVAILTDSRWPPLIAWLENFFLEAEVRAFDDEGTARSWLAGDED